MCLWILVFCWEIYFHLSCSPLMVLLPGYICGGLFVIMSSIQVAIWRMVMWCYILACEPITETIGFRQLLIDKLWCCTIGQWAGLTNWLIWGGDGGSSSEEGQGSPSTFGIVSKLLMCSCAFCKSAQSPFHISFEHCTWGLCLWALVNNFLKLSCNSTLCAIPDILGGLHKLSSSLLPELILSLKSFWALCFSILRVEVSG